MHSRAFVLAVALLALATAAHATPVYYTFSEATIGDAGRPGDPVHIGPEGVVYDAIAGTIGAGGDNSDAYLFYFGGGRFTALSTRPGDPINIYRPGDPITPFATSTLKASTPASSARAITFWNSPPRTPSRKIIRSVSSMRWATPSVSPHLSQSRTASGSRSRRWD
jgi:hypothetical protein